jgi:hypothetical protein
MKVDIDGLDETALLDLNRRIVERIRAIRRSKDLASMRQFAVGERVAFQPPGATPVVGILTRHNTKSVTVVAEDGRRWNVAPALLRAVIDGPF